VQGVPDLQVQGVPDLQVQGVPDLHVHFPAVQVLFPVDLAPGSEKTCEAVKKKKSERIRSATTR
jgi:hypothetical protein